MTADPTRCHTCGDTRTLTTDPAGATLCRACRATAAPIVVEPDPAPPPPAPTADGGKVCTNPDCQLAGQAQPLDAFHRRADTRDGRQSWCKACVAGVKGDPASRRARARAWAKADAETKRRHPRTWNAAYRRALKAEGIKP